MGVRDRANEKSTEVQLATFITSNIEPILVEWETFARHIWPPGAPVDPVELRDSAEEILRALVADMNSPQSLCQQSEKAAGRRPRSAESDRLDHASEVHGAARFGSGLTLLTVVSEYRALRASVLRLWRASNPTPSAEDLDDLTRFNEAIDQSLTLAIGAYTQRVDDARHMFLGILSHDLRNPLAAIAFTAKIALGRALPLEIAQQLSQILMSANTMSGLISDLIDFTTSALGAHFPVNPRAADLHVICDEVIREVSAAYGSKSIRLSVRGDLAGTWDAHRLRQAIANLLGNAHQHGSPNTLVAITADGTDANNVTISVHNDGTPIPPGVLPNIFDPLVRAPSAGDKGRKAGSVGLGLYIVREVALAHGGNVDITSTATIGTTVTMRIPRHCRTRARVASDAV